MSTDSRSILVLGGTRFIGPHIVECLADRGHQITLFNRGETDPDRFADVEQLRGDRDSGDVSALEDRSWNGVVDTSAYHPRAVRQTLRTLGDGPDHYLLLSTLSVYRDFAQMGIDEDYPLKSPETDTERVDSETDGPLKVACERTAEERAPGRLTILRPGVVVGPEDPTDRFTYWPARAARGGEMLAPGAPDHGTQYIDVRDLAEFTVQCLEQHVTGTYNVVIPPARTTIGDIVKTSRRAIDGSATTTWVDGDFLERHDVEPWRDLPLWAPPATRLQGLASIRTDRAQEVGLEVRSLETTVADTLEWFRSLPDSRRDNLRAGLERDRERALLRAWHADHADG